MVFGTLLLLTGLTVGIAYIHFEPHIAIALGLAVATTKGALVALVFMHLSNEVSAIYRLLALTFAFFFLILILPTSWWADDVKQASVWSQNVPASRMQAADDHHSGGH
jgi:caa(3)-type oxidase subunit IV